MPSSRDDRPAQHYGWSHRLEAWLSTKLFDRLEYRVRRGLLRGMKRRGGLAWMPESLVPHRPTAEERFWREHDLSGQVVYDVGAFQGLLTLHFARQAKTVVSFEPAANNRARLLRNVQLNELSNVRVEPVGLAASHQAAELVQSTLMPGGGSVDKRIAAQIRAGRHTRSEAVTLRALDAYAFELDLPAPNFVKVDVEGLEADVLRGGEQLFREHRPELFLEMHGDTRREKERKVREIVRLLQDLGYGTIQHVETQIAVGPDNCELAARGHLFAKP